MAYPRAMKTVLVGALTLLLGLFLGGLGPRAELRRARTELTQAREAAASGGVGLLPALGLGGLAAARDRAQSDARRRVPKFNPPDKPEPSAAAAPTAPDPGEDSRPRQRSASGDASACSEGMPMPSRPPRPRPP